jgi:hypothetical protein
MFAIVIILASLKALDDATKSKETNSSTGKKLTLSVPKISAKISNAFDASYIFSHTYIIF